MLRHVVVLRFKTGTSPAQIAALVEGLEQLRRSIPDIADYRFGTDAGYSEGNDTFAVVADFADAEAFRRYVADSSHQELIERLIRPILDTRHAVQFEC